MDFGEIILDLLSSATCGETSINMLSKQLKENGFSGDYKNTYQKIMKFEKDNLLITTQIGKSKTISLNYQNPKTISKLAIMELSKKIDFIEKNQNFSKILLDLQAITSEFILMTNPQKNINLNRIEILILTENPLETLKKCNGIEEKYSIRIDCLALKNKDFAKLIKSNNSTIAEMLTNKIILTNQEHFFELAGDILAKNNLNRRNYSLTDLNEAEIRYNLSKFGYSEFGKELKSKELSFEESIISTLILGTARQKTALKNLIIKNEFNPELLAFFAKKYSKQKEIQTLINNNKTNPKLNELNKLMSWMKMISW